MAQEPLGLVGAVTARAEAQALRLSVLYALLDRSPVIRVPHLQAALALWRYAEASAHYLFGDKLGSATADAILDALRTTPEGLTRTAISNLFSRNRDREQIEAALTLLADQGLAHSTERETGGRPVVVWEATATRQAVEAVEADEADEPD
jgi:hypothetical protein